MGPGIKLDSEKCQVFGLWFSAGCGFVSSWHCLDNVQGAAR